MNKLFKSVSPIFFWSSMMMVSMLLVFLLSLNYKIIIIKSVAAAEATSVSISRNAVDIKEVNNYISCDCEKRFISPVAVVWSGQVIASFVGGLDIGVQKYDQSDEYNQFYVIGEGKYGGDLGRDVKVTGRLVGITCAYANSVFGECVGEVAADDIEVINMEIKKVNQ